MFVKYISYFRLTTVILKQFDFVNGHTNKLRRTLKEVLGALRQNLTTFADLNVNFFNNSDTQ